MIPNLRKIPIPTNMHIENTHHFYTSSPMIIRKYITSCSIFLFFLLLTLGSCIPHNQNGYPKKIHFSSKGGTEIVQGNYKAYDITIYEGTDAKGYTDENGIIQYEWLTVRRISEANLEVTALPNDTYKKRKLSIFLDFGAEYGEITVTQKGR